MPSFAGLDFANVGRMDFIGARKCSLGLLALKETNHFNGFRIELETVCI